MDESIVIKDISKIYSIFDTPKDRFMEALGFHGKKYHWDFYALDKVSFTIHPGEIVGIVGRNGSGKSTLLKIITGVVSPTDGEIKVNGKLSALLELGAGFNMEYTGRKNIYLNATMQGVSKEDIEKKIPNILAFADIGDYIDQPVKTYSSGMFVRLAFSVAVHVNPDILIVDEALAVGDTKFQLKCMNKFVEFMDAGKTILYVSHDINSIKRFCSRAIWLNQGKMVMDGEVDLVTDRYIDFLRSDLTIEEFMEKYSAAMQSRVITFDSRSLDTIEFAEVYSAQILNSNGKETDLIHEGEKVSVLVSYLVNDETIESPVLGVAIRRIDNEYICGLNTKLDNVRIPWKKGYNEVTLTYEKMLLTGGDYYLDIALFDQTATVVFDYKTKYKNFSVKMDYIAEGIVVLDHFWDTRNRHDG